ncbi:MAG: hypothetical protein WBM67_15505, partial [Sedimenticolaceae bacterium]
QTRRERSIAALGQTNYYRLGLMDIFEVAEAAAASAEFASSLRATQQQHTNYPDFLGRELQAAEANIAKPVLILGHPTAEPSTITDQVLFQQAIEDMLDLCIAKVHDGVTAAFLVAGVCKCA